MGYVIDIFIVCLMLSQIKSKQTSVQHQLYARTAASIPVAIARTKSEQMIGFVPCKHVSISSPKAQ